MKGSPISQKLQRFVRKITVQESPIFLDAIEHCLGSNANKGRFRRIFSYSQDRLTRYLQNAIRSE